MIAPITILREAVYLRFVTVRFAPDPSCGAGSGPHRKSDLRLIESGNTRESSGMPASSEVSPGMRFPGSTQEEVTMCRPSMTERE